MGGYETVQRLRALDPEGAGHRFERVFQRSDRSPTTAATAFTGAIAKPYQMAELGKVLEEVTVGQSRPGTLASFASAAVIFRLAPAA